MHCYPLKSLHDQSEASPSPSLSHYRSQRLLKKQWNRYHSHNKDKGSWLDLTAHQCCIAMQGSLHEIPHLAKSWSSAHCRVRLPVPQVVPLPGPPILQSWEVGRALPLFWRNLNPCCSHKSYHKTFCIHHRPCHQMMLQCQIHYLQYWRISDHIRTS